MSKQKVKPIIFQDAMVRALLEGRKTQTRRVIKPQPEEGLEVSPLTAAYPKSYPAGWAEPGANIQLIEDGECLHWQCPYGQPGDLLVPAVEIDGYGGKYAAGLDGRVYSKARGDWRPLKEWRQPKGYKTVTLVPPEGGKKSKSVHRLVCEAFYGPRPSPSHEVRHLDGNPENGVPENLAWGTREQNWQDRKAHGNGIEGEKHNSAKFADEEREHIRWAVANGLTSQRNAARVLGVAQGVISEICKWEAEPAEQDILVGRIPSMTLRLTNVRVERVQEISEEDARAEGYTFDVIDGEGPVWQSPSGYKDHDHRGAFAQSWDSHQGEGSFDANPWVWCLEFEVIEANLDDVLRKEAQ